MTNFYRVEGPRARRLFAELRTRAKEGHPLFTGVSHRSAFPAPFGDKPVDRTLLGVREAVLEIEAQSVSRREFRARLGGFLGAGAGIQVTDAGTPGVWNYMALVLLPDVVLRDSGSPDSPQHFLCIDPVRHRLARYWIRERVLGEYARGRGHLAEDEMVQLTERGQVARNTRLVRALCAHIEEVPHVGREAYTRELVRRVTARTGAVAVDALTDSQLQDLVHSEASTIPRDRRRPGGATRR